jgi:HSP20 family protein
MDLDTDDDGKTVIVTFELPGVKKEDVNVDVYHGILSISGEKKQGKPRHRNAHSVHERKFGRFMRTLHLPEGVKVRIFCKTLIDLG